MSMVRRMADERSCTTMGRSESVSSVHFDKRSTAVATEQW